MKGTVKWFNDARGFGLIEPDERDDNVFVHFSEIETEGFETLEKGMRVEFELEVRPDKCRARKVCPIETNGAVRLGR